MAENVFKVCLKKMVARVYSIHIRVPSRTWRTVDIH